MFGRPFEGMHANTVEAPERIWKGDQTDRGLNFRHEHSVVRVFGLVPIDAVSRFHPIGGRTGARLPECDPNISVESQSSRIRYRCVFHFVLATGRLFVFKCWMAPLY